MVAYLQLNARVLLALSSLTTLRKLAKASGFKRLLSTLISDWLMCVLQIASKQRDEFVGMSSSLFLTFHKRKQLTT